MRISLKWIISAFLLASSATHHAHATEAGDIVFSDTSLISGPVFSSKPFEITDVHLSYKTTLKDFGFPAPLDALGLAITYGSSLLGSTVGPGSFTFSAPAPGTYLAHIIAIPGDFMGFDTGLYNAQVMAVPEVEMWLMLLVGLGLVGYQIHRHRKEQFMLFPSLPKGA